MNRKIDSRILLISFFCLTFIAISCSKKSKNSDEDFGTLSIEQRMAKEYGINYKEINLWNYVQTIPDTTKIAFIGNNKGKLWGGIFDKLTKKEVTLFLDNKPIDSTLTIDKGYGETQAYRFTEFRTNEVVYNNGLISFIFRGLIENNVFGGYSDFYMIQNKSKIIYKRALTIVNTSYNDFYGRLSPWHNGIIIESSNNFKTIYSSSGDSLYSLKDFPKLNYNTLVNYEEYISGGIHLGTADIGFSRRNIKTNSMIWDKMKSTTKTYPTDLRTDSTIISKNGSMWQHTIYYTLKSGAKGQVVCNVDINSGDFDIIE